MSLSWIFRIAAALTVLLGGASASALSSQRLITQYAHDVWASRDGLPEGAVLAIQQTADGYLWLGTQCCLVRYDGERFQEYPSGELGLGQYSFVRDLLETPQRELWAASVGGVARYANDRFDWFAEAQGLSHPFVYALASGSDGAISAGTGGAGVWQLVHSQFVLHTAYAVDPTLPAAINDLATDSAGTLWAATDAGVVSMGTPARRFAVDSGLPSDRANVLAFDHEGTLWVGTRLGLARSVDESGLRFEQLAELGSVDVTALLEDRNENLWIGTREVLYRMSSDGLMSQPFGRGGIFALAEDSEGALWVGTGEGLERYRNGAFVTAGTPEGFATDQILNVTARHGGGLWVLDGSGALWLEEQGRRTPVSEPGKISGGGMLDMAESADGSLWIASKRLMRFRRGEWTEYEYEDGGFSVVEEDGDGLLLARTRSDGQSSILRFREGHFSAVSVGAPLMHVQRLHRDGAGRLWISTGGSGLVRLSSGATRVFRRGDGLPHDVVYGLAEASDGTLWVATRGGLARIRGETVVGFENVPGVPRRSPVHVHLDGLGHLWVTADDGIHRLNLAELDRVADGSASSVEDLRFTSQDGLRSIEVSWRAAAQAVARDGRLYYATARGLSSVDPRSVQPSTAAPPVRIESVSLAGQLFEGIPREVLISDRRGRLELRYSSPALSDPGLVEFRFRLEGYESEWVQAGHSRTAHYSNLPAGDYRFSVSARRNQGSWLSSATTLRVRVLPRWYETVSVRAVIFLALGLVGLGIYRLQLARLKRQERILAARVAERTEELRQEVIERQAAETKVRELAVDLEERVRERTAELELANLAAHRHAERFALAVRGAQDGLWDWDLTTGLLYLSPRWKAMLGYADQALDSSLESWLAHVHPDDLTAFRYAFEPRADHPGQIQHEFRMRDRSDAELWVSCRGIMLFDADRRPQRAAGSLTDITRHKLTEAELHRNATHDALTGLANRSLFAERLGQAVIRARHGSGGSCAVLFLDLDHFKAVNDGFGHAAGDQLLVELGRRLQTSLRETETAARLGGDEFAILLPDLPEDDYATKVAERIQKLVSLPVEVLGSRVTVGASIGIKLGTGRHSELDDYMRDADMAMYQAKAKGRGRHQIFDVRMRDQAIERSRIEAGLRGALEQGHLTLFYQPLISLQDGVAVGVEALVRWRDPLRGLVLPGTFIGVAESTGLIAPLSEWVLEAACEQARIWQGTLRRPVCISVNVPPALLNDARLASKIESQLSRHGLSGSALSVEIVETSVLETSSVVLDNLHSLRDLGVKIAIDDFGTGYSSFGYLKRLPITYLKIDRSLIQNIPFDMSDMAICKAILLMASQLGLQAVAEGVEKPDQVAFLGQNGCELVQGYYFSRPLPAEDCAPLLNRSLFPPAPPCQVVPGSS